MGSGRPVVSVLYSAYSCPAGPVGARAWGTRHRSTVIKAIVAPPECLRDLAESGGQLSEKVPTFSQQDFDKFKRGYESQYSELSFWIDDKDIEGTHE